MVGGLMNIESKQTTTITLTLSAFEAQRIIDDFDKSKEPSIQGKILYSSLIKATHATS